MKEKQKYQSPLREEQMKRTREQILEALARVMARGVTDLSIPAVAREAGVSVPTVYRYFRTKSELVEAMGSYAVQKLGFSQRQLPRSPEELAESVKELYVKYEGLDEVMRAAAASGLSYEMRKEVLQFRLKMFEDALAPVAAQFDEADRIRLRNVILVLCSTATIRAFKDYLDLAGEEAADNVIWAIRTLTRATSNGRDGNG
jgi:AcrR family transcriptional regulator